MTVQYNIVFVDYLNVIDIAMPGGMFVKKRVATFDVYVYVRQTVWGSSEKEYSALKINSLNAL